MNNETFKRRLTAIFSADVVGYSRLMGEDEEATILTLKAYRTAMRNFAGQYRGRVVDSPGDNILAEFVSVLDAVNCSVAIQRELAERNSNLPENRRMQFRIGVNLGDIVEDGERIYGDGVNIAARMESLADGGGICISGKVYEEVKHKLPLRYEYLGKRAVKNISDPVRAYKVSIEEGVAVPEISIEKKAKYKYLQKAALWLSVLLILAFLMLIIFQNLLRPSYQPEKVFPNETADKPKLLTILVRMMEPQENWFIQNILKKFENTNNCKITLKRFDNDNELVEILRKDAQAREIGRVSLVKTPLHMTLLLQEEGLLIPYDQILSNLGFGDSDIKSLLGKIRDDYESVALEMCRFSTITRENLYFLPRKLETRLMIYRQSKVAEAVKNWHKFIGELNDQLKMENGYGLPNHYSLEPDANQWDFYDLFVAGYYWANTYYNGRRLGRIAHRSKNYAGTVLGLIDKALQLGAIEEDIHNMNKLSEPVIDMFHWESLFRKYNLYSQGMFEDTGWYGHDIYKGIKKEDVFLTWLHQLDLMLVYGSDKLGMESFLPEGGDLAVSLMPKGVSFELTKDGQPKRIGTKKAHIFGWFWGIPKGSSEPELGCKLALFITGYESHREECKNFLIIPITKRVHHTLKGDLKEAWQIELFEKSFEQFKINGNHFVPRFKTLADYQEFLNKYYAAFENIVTNRRYSLGGPLDKVDRDFIRDNMR